MEIAQVSLRISIRRIRDKGEKNNELTFSEAKGALQTRPHLFLCHPPWAPIYGGDDYGMA